MWEQHSSGQGRQARQQPLAPTAYFSKAHEIPATKSNIPSEDKLNAYSQQALEVLLCILTGSPRPGLEMQQVPEKVIPGLILMAQLIFQMNSSSLHEKGQHTACKTLAKEIPGILHQALLQE